MQAGWLAGNLRQENEIADRQDLLGFPFASLFQASTFTAHTHLTLQFMFFFVFSVQFDCPFVSWCHVSIARGEVIFFCKPRAPKRAAEFCLEVGSSGFRFDEDPLHLFDGVRRGGRGRGSCSAAAAASRPALKLRVQLLRRGGRGCRGGVRRRRVGRRRRRVAAPLQSQLPASSSTTAAASSSSSSRSSSSALLPSAARRVLRTANFPVLWVYN